MDQIGQAQQSTLDRHEKWLLVLAILGAIGSVAELAQFFWIVTR